MDAKFTKNVNISVVKMCSNFCSYFDYMLSEIIHKLDRLHSFLIITWHIFLFQLTHKNIL